MEKTVGVKKRRGASWGLPEQEGASHSQLYAVKERFEKNIVGDQSMQA